jgi:hypothetical protein
MTNDAKLGLVVGIGVVILIAIVFFRKDPILAHAAPDPKAPAQVQSASVVALPSVPEPLALTPSAPAPAVHVPSDPEPLVPVTPKTRSR